MQAGVAGAERMTVLYGKTLPRDCYEVKFYPVIKGTLGKNKISDFIPEGYAVNFIPPCNPLRLMAVIAKVISTEQPDYVFSSVLYLNDKILLLRKFFPKTKFIIRCENYWYTFSDKQHRLIKAIYPLADTIVAQTKEMKDELIENTKVPEDKILVLENPIDTATIDALMLDQHNPYPQDGVKHFVAVGRFSYQKGFDLLVKAYTKLLHEGCQGELYILGTYDGVYQSQYNEFCALAKDLGVSERVHCLGYNRNPYPYIRYADAFVLSSRWEGLPNVLIESLYLGTPVAAYTCIPFVGRVIKDGQNGYCADKEDVNSLANAMRAASEMGRCTSPYKGTSSEQIIALFSK